MSLILLCITLIYCLAIFALIYGFTKANSFEYLGLKPKTNFSIIVPFRNEAENLPVLLDSLSALNYPMDGFDVILVDDESEKVFRVQPLDFSVKIIKNNRVSNSPKKDAILTALQFVTTDWIITTDADCVVNKNWLLSLDNYIQLHTVSMLAGAVTYACETSFLHHFQQLDFASLQGATIGSFGIGKGFMCNGANFAYTKSFFTALNGFEGNDSIASGDDVFLLQKALNRFPEKVHYLKSSHHIVITKPLNDWRSLFFQRVRWASKTTSYQSRFGIVLGLVVFGGNVCWLIAVGWLLLGNEKELLMCFLMIAKFVVDAVLIYKTNCFLTKKRIDYLMLSSLFYPFFSVSVALYSLFGKYEWKGRRFSK